MRFKIHLQEWYDNLVQIFTDSIQHYKLIEWAIYLVKKPASMYYYTRLAALMGDGISMLRGSVANWNWAENGWAYYLPWLTLDAVGDGCQGV